ERLSRGSPRRSPARISLWRRSARPIMTRTVESKMTGVSVPTAVDHDVPLYLASDEALIYLLDRYPADLFDITSYAFEPDGQVRLAKGARGEASGRAVLEAIKSGRLRVNLRSC